MDAAVCARVLAGQTFGAQVRGRRAQRAAPPRAGGVAGGIGGGGPPLRDRREDLPPLARRFIAFLARAVGRAVPELSPDAARVLADHEWPGNVRELRNAIERAMILWPSAVLDPLAFPDRVAGARARAAARRAAG
mgnify:CR=1 FL=1